MSGVLVIARATLGELTRRRVVVVVAALTTGFLALFELANQVAFHNIAGGRTQSGGVLVDQRTLAGASLVGLGMFADLFLGAVLAVFLTMSAVRGDAEQGLMQPLVVREPGRAAFLAGRIVAAAGVAGLYTFGVYLASVAITGQAGGWWPNNIVVPGLALALAVIVLRGDVAARLHLPVHHPQRDRDADGLRRRPGGRADRPDRLRAALPEAAGDRPRRVVGAALRCPLPGRPALADRQHAGLTGVIVHLGPLGGAQAAGPGLAVWAVAYLVVVLAAAAGRSAGATSDAPA